MKKLSVMIAVLLAGCGGGSDVIVSFPGQQPEPVADAFVAQVHSVIASMPEDSEAAAIDSMAAVTAPEDSDATSL